MRAQAATRLAGLGSSLFTGTSELLGQVSGAIAHELDALEGGGGGGGSRPRGDRLASHSSGGSGRCGRQPGMLPPRDALRLAAVVLISC